MAGVTVAVHNDATGADLDPGATGQPGNIPHFAARTGNLRCNGFRQGAAGIALGFQDDLFVGRRHHRNTAASAGVGEITRIDFRDHSGDGLSHAPTEAVVSRLTSCNVPATRAIQPLGFRCIRLALWLLGMDAGYS